MKIKLIWVGRTKESFIIEGLDKYLKLLKPYAEISITEIKDEKTTDVSRMLEKEGERIMSLKGPYTLLDEKGELLDSSAFAGFIQKKRPSITFLLGGAYGVSEKVKKSAQTTISLSKMTLTHEMSRLVLLEQIYRGFTILNKRGYHH